VDRFREVDPGDLHLPPPRASGADPFKLAEQIRRFGDSVLGMPPVEVTEARDGALMINDGVTAPPVSPSYGRGIQSPSR
jgi:hypothetical protein